MTGQSDVADVQVLSKTAVGDADKIPTVYKDYSKREGCGTLCEVHGI